MAKRQEHTIIAFTGRMNVGKSSLLNLLSGQKDFAIVDDHPGTTTDVVATKMEIHGIGPIKALDTAGLDEDSALGKKKRKKVFEVIEEADLTFIMIDLLKTHNSDFALEKQAIKKALEYHNQVLILYNLFPNKLSLKQLNHLENQTNQKLNLNSNQTPYQKNQIPSLRLNVLNSKEQKNLIDFIHLHLKTEKKEIDLIPLKAKEGYVLLNIPMDEETPQSRLLRPQDMAVEKLLRKQFIPVLFRMDLKKARQGEKKEQQRFLNLIDHLKNSPEGLKLVITDSQAIDTVNNLVPSDILLTTFSVIMANYMSYGNLALFQKGLKAFSNLKNKDKILIMESCNHNRQCNDIGTQQIPNLIKEKLGLNLEIDFSFGRVMPEDINPYKLIIHCGGCMIDRQKYARRILKIKAAEIPITNYGLFLSWVHNAKAAERVVEIFKI